MPMCKAGEGNRPREDFPETSERKLQQLCPITQKHVQQQLPWFIYLNERVQNSLYGYRLKCITRSGDADQFYSFFFAALQHFGDTWFGL